MDRLQGASDLFEERLEKAKEQVAIAADHARQGIRRGRKAVVSLEQNVVRVVRQNPLLILFAAAGLLGFVLAGRWMLRRRERRALRLERRAEVRF